MVLSAASLVVEMLSPMAEPSVLSVAIELTLLVVVDTRLRVISLAIELSELSTVMISTSLAVVDTRLRTISPTPKLLVFVLLNLVAVYSDDPGKTYFSVDVDELLFVVAAAVRPCNISRVIRS